MTPGNDKPDAALSDHARRLGFLSSNCDSCGASGMRGPCVDPHDQSGPLLDEACADCSGSGRWWYPAIRGLGTFTAHLTDTQLRAHLTASREDVTNGH